MIFGFQQAYDPFTFKMAEAHVLRFARSDEEGGFVLVHAKQTRSKALDMKLIGTDGLAPYVISRELCLLFGPARDWTGWAGKTLGARCFMRRRGKMAISTQESCRADHLTHFLTQCDTAKRHPTCPRTAPSPKKSGSTF